jgi:hypothetical protein
MSRDAVGQRQERPAVSARAPAAFVPRQFGLEGQQGTADEPDRAVRMAARSSAGNQPGPALEVGAGPPAGPGSGQLGQGGGDAGQPVQARPALAGGLRQPADAVATLFLMHLAIALVTYNLLVWLAPSGPAPRHASGAPKVLFDADAR